MQCGGVTKDVSPTVVDNGDYASFTAVFSSSDFPSDCCSDSGTNDITVQFVLTKCCLAEHKVCEWTWNAVTREWDLTGDTTCWKCFCLDKPEHPGSTGETAETTCSLGIS
jgi:hypothetical protein